MNDEWDLIRLQSITLGGGALNGDGETYESNELIMRSMNDNDADWSDLPSLTLLRGESVFVFISQVMLESDECHWIWIRYSNTP